MENEDYVRASEMGEYVYCKRAWWLRFNNLIPKSKSMVEGTIEHEKISDLLEQHQRKLRFGWTIVILGILFLAILLMIFLL